MSYLKHTVLNTEKVASGFVFSKWHAMGLALFFLLFMIASYYFQQWLMTKMGENKAPAPVEPFWGMDDWFVSSRGPLIPFRKPPHAAVECRNDPAGPWYYEQGVDGTSSHCTEHCPAPTLPDEDGHCRAGLSEP